MSQKNGDEMSPKFVIAVTGVMAVAAAVLVLDNRHQDSAASWPTLLAEEWQGVKGRLRAVRDLIAAVGTPLT